MDERSLEVGKPGRRLWKGPKEGSRKPWLRLAMTHRNLRIDV